MNLQEILEHNDLFIYINNNFNVLSFYIQEIKMILMLDLLYYIMI